MCARVTSTRAYVLSAPTVGSRVGYQRVAEKLPENRKMGAGPFAPTLSFLALAYSYGDFLQRHVGCKG